MTEANRRSCSCEGANDDFNTEDFCDVADTDDTAVPAEEFLVTTPEEDFRLILIEFVGISGT